MRLEQKNIGFTPIDKSEVFRSSPKLEELFKIKSAEVFFKKPENNFLEKMDNQERVQGSVVMPDDKSCIDFELVSDFLMSNSSIAIAIRDLVKSNKFGITENDFKIIKGVDLNTLKDAMKTMVLEAPKISSFKLNADISVAQKNINTHANTLNEKISMQQNTNDYSPPSTSSLKR